MDNKKISQICLGLSLLFLLTLVGARSIVGGWIDIFYAPLVAFLALLFLGLGLNFKSYISFFTMKTTKKGFNTGSLILLMLLFLAAINYFSVRTNVNIDLTNEKLFTLSEQSVLTVKKIKQPAQVLVFFRGKQDSEIKRRIGDLIGLYSQKNKNLTIKYINVYENPVITQKYLSQQDAEGKGLVVFIDYQDKIIRVDHPHQEEQLTQALVKTTQLLSKSIYFITGHKERELNTGDADPEGISLLRKTLQDYSFKTEVINMSESIQIPGDAAVLVIIAAKSTFLQKELEEIQRYIESGGTLVVALDPGQHTNLYAFLKKYGINYVNNYVLDPNSSLGQSVVIANEYSSSYAITKDFGAKSSVFNLVSEVRAEAIDGFKIDEFVFSAAGSVIINDLQNPKANKEKGSFPVAVSSEFAKSKVVAFGDSDFLNNQFIFAFSNRDLIVNTFAYLTQQRDLISIKPKDPTTTFIYLTQGRTIALVLGSLTLPVLLLLISFIVWVRRRGE